jgi:hypothetical protein
LINTNSTISNCEIHDIGQINTEGASGLAIYSVGTNASWNHIYNCPRWAIGMGGNDNVVEYNYIHDINQRTEDSGAIYLGGRSWISQRGNLVSHNVINKTGGFCSVADSKFGPNCYTWGIYLDDGACGIKVKDNVVINPYSSGIVLSGRDNIIEGNTIIEPVTWHSNIYMWSSGTYDGNPSYYDGLYNSLLKVKNSELGYDGAEFYRRYPELNSITQANITPILYGNKILNNTIVYNQGYMTPYSFPDNDEVNSKQQYDYNTILRLAYPVSFCFWFPGGYVMPCACSQGLPCNWSTLRSEYPECDPHGVDVSDFYSVARRSGDPYDIFKGDAYFYVVNLEKQTKTFDLGGNYCNLKNEVINSVTLKPHDSAIILKCFCNGDKVCNNRETTATCPAECTGSLGSSSFFERLWGWFDNLFR